MTTYYARKDYIYSTGDRIFTIPFSYIDREHIKVYINNIQTTNFVFNTASQILILDTLQAEDVVSIRRTTPINTKLVEFTDTSMLNEDNLNLSSQQTFNVVQEMYDSNTNLGNNVLDVIEDYQSNTLTTIENYKNSMTESNNAFKQEVNIAIQTVADAAGRINTLDNSIEECKGYADIAFDNAATTINLLAGTLGYRELGDIDVYIPDIDEDVDWEEI